jgi:predicted esterase YcpF (UPF0227 family)
MLLYLHGFNSSSQSGKAQQLLAWAAERGLAAQCPDLPVRPAAAMALCSRLIADSVTPVTLIGSSLGGYYATWLAEEHNLKAVLVNPCVACDEKLAREVGRTQKNWHDGSAYVFGPEHLDELRALKKTAISRPDRYLLLVEKGDLVLDFREAVTYFAGCEQVVLEGGDHGFTRWADYLEKIAGFAA